jgi:hypothetical protein
MSNAASPPVGSRASRKWVRRAGALLILLVVGIVAWSILSPQWDSTSPQQFQERLRTEVPVGASQDHIQEWIKRNGLNPAWSATDQFNLPALSQLAGVPNASVADVVRIGLPGVAAWDIQMRPYRTDVYILVDQNGQMVGSYSHTYPEQPLPKRVLPCIGL